MFRNLTLWTTSKIALFLLVAVATQPIKAVEYHIGGSDTPDGQTIFATLEDFRIAKTGTSTAPYPYHLSDGDVLILYRDDYSLTKELGIAHNSTVTVRSDDPDVSRNINIIDGNTTRFFNMNRNSGSSTPGSTLDFEGIKTVKGGNGAGDPGGSTDGGAIYGWWYNSINARGVTFQENKSLNAYMGGGAIYLWDTYDVDLTDASFIDNVTSGRGGAVYTNTSASMGGLGRNNTEVTIGASDGMISTYRGNRHLANADGTGGQANSFDFTGSTGFVINFHVKTEGTGVVDMQDPFRTNMGGYTVNITKTGTGTWKLDGRSVVDGSGGAKIRIEQGTLEFYRGASLEANGTNDSFTVIDGGRVTIKGSNRIEGKTVTFGNGANLNFDMSAFFDTVNPNSRDTALLFLQGETLTVAGSLISIEFPDGLASAAMRGDYTLIEGAEEFAANIFTLTVNGEVITNKRFGYALDQTFENQPEDKKTLVLHVGDTRNSVLDWNNAAENNRWSFNDDNFFDAHVNRANDSFIPNDTVIFKTTGTHAITLSGPMILSKDNNFNTGERGMRVSGDGNWTFNAGSLGDNYSTVAGVMNGPDFLAALIFDGTGTLTLNNADANTYHDGTYISGGGVMTVVDAGSLGSADFAGSPTTGGRVQNGGYGIEFSADGGTIRFRNGTTLDPVTQQPTDHVLQQRIGIRAGTEASLVNLDANRPVVISAHDNYAGYAPNKNGGAVNVGAGAEFTTTGAFLFAENVTVQNGGAIFAGADAVITSAGSAYVSNEALKGGAIYHTGNTTQNELVLNVRNSLFGTASTDPATPTTTGNEAEEGGAIYLVDGKYMRLDATGAQFHGNEATVGSGGAVYVGTSGDAPPELIESYIILDNATFSGNTAQRDGGAVWLPNAAGRTVADSFAYLSAVGATFADNTAGLGDGGAIRGGSNSDIRVSDQATNRGATFTGNTAGNFGGAIAVGEDGTIMADFTVFTENQATLKGGAVYIGQGVSGYRSTFNGATFTGNTLTNAQGMGGAIYAEGAARISAQAARFHDNGVPASGIGAGIAGLYGGAIRLGTGSELDAAGGEFLRNQVKAGNSQGGAIFVESGGTLGLDRTVFRDNSARGSGGAIAIGTETAPSRFQIQASGTVFEGNVAENGSGGAIIAAQHSLASSIVAQSSTFKQNTALSGEGGAIRVNDGADGALLRMDFSRATTKSLFEGNLAGRSGGAVYAGNFINLNAANVDFLNNKASLHGGAIRVGDNSTMDISAAGFLSNIIDGATGEGGAVYAGNNTAVTGTNAVFRGNGALVDPDNPSKAGRYGGAVRAGNNANLNFDAATFTENVLFGTSSRGGALYTGTNAVFQASGAIFEDNLAQTDGGAVYAGATARIVANGARFEDNTAVKGNGGAIYVANESLINVSRTVGGVQTVFSGNSAGNAGGAVFMANLAAGTSLKADGVMFTSNTAGKYGGAIRVGNGTGSGIKAVSLDGTTFSDNKILDADGEGGALWLGNNLRVEGTGTIFTNNGTPDAVENNGGNIQPIAGLHGGAVRIGSEAYLVFENSEFKNNMVNAAGSRGGAVYSGTGTSLQINKSKFEKNTAKEDGGAVFMLGTNAATLSAQGATFRSNTAEGGDGGALHVGRNTKIELAGLSAAEKTELTSNTAGKSGGAVYFEGGQSLDLSNATLTRNKAGASGGAIHAGTGTAARLNGSTVSANTAELSGGAMYFRGSEAEKNTLHLTGATFQNNAALGGDGGAIYAVYTEFQGAPVSFLHNSATGSGGAMYVGAGNYGPANFDGTVFNSNRADADGGALYFKDVVDLTADGAVFSSNTARSGGAIHATKNGDIRIDNATFTTNFATGGNGGAIRLGEAGTVSTLVARNSEFTGNNTETGSGGAIYAVDTDFDLFNTTFAGNSAEQKGGAILLQTTGGVRNLAFGADDGIVAGFSGNAVGNNSSAIHFMGTGADMTTINMTVDTKRGGTFELLDSLVVDATTDNVKLNLVKTGAGTMYLGNVHDLRGTAAGSSIDIREGVFDMKLGAKIFLQNDDRRDSFAMEDGSKLYVAGQNEISASDILLTDQIYFDLNGTRPNSDAVALKLIGTVDTVSGLAIGAKDINIIEFVEQPGLYNLVQAEGGRLTDTGTLYYKGIKVENNDRLFDYYELNVNAEKSILQIELRPWENTTMTWTGEVDGLWNVEKRNWTGRSEGINVTQFIDGDSVVFGDAGAGTVEVSPHDVVVGDMMIVSDKDYVFQGGTVRGNMFQKYGTGSLTMNNRFLFDNFEVYQGMITGGVGSGWSFVGNIDFKNGSVFRPTDRFRVDGNISMKTGSLLLLELGKTQKQSSSISAAGTIDFSGEGGSVLIAIANGGLGSGQYAPDGAILTAENGLTLGGAVIADGTYGANRRIVQISDGTEAITFQSDRSLALQAVVVSEGSTELSLLALGTGFEAYGPTAEDFNTNQMAIYEALENAPYLSLANTFFVELAKLGSVEEKADALDAMVTTVNNASMLVAERNIIRAASTIYDRLRLLNETRRYEQRHPAVRGQMSFGRQANLSPWFTQLGDIQDQDDSRVAPGFKSKMYGFMLGVDRSFGRDTVFGIGLGGTFASVESGMRQSGKVNTFLATAYGSYSYDDWTFAGNLGIASSEYNLKRRIFTLSSESKLRGDSFFGGVELSKMLRYNMLDVVPYASLNVVTVDVGTYRDYSLGGIGGVKIDSGDSNAFLQTFGVKLGRAFTGSRGAVWTPNLTAGWIHDYGKGRLRSTTTYGGTVPFTTIGAERARDRMLLGVGTNIALRRLVLFGSYDSELSGRYNSHTFQAGLNLAF